MSSPSTCPTYNGDSPLSTTSSILSILTFGLGLFGFYLAIYSSTRSAPAEISRLVSDLRSTQAEINRVSQWIFSADSLLALPSSSASYRDNGIYDEVQELLRNCIRLFIETDDLLKRFEKRQGAGLCRRVLFLINRDEVLEKVGRLQEQKVRLGNIQMSLFLR